MSTTPHRLGVLPVFPIGFGCMGLSQGYGPADDETSQATLRAAAEAGVTLFDTAMSYGAGDNERLLGRTLPGLGPVRVATKFGIVRGPDGVTVDGRPEHLRGYCEASLARLGRDVIDLYYLHRVDPEVPVAETVSAMADLVDAGLVRQLGLSEVSPAQLREAHAVHPITAVQFEWSMMWRQPESDIVPAARELGVGLVAYSPMGRGLLSATLDETSIAASSFRSGDPRFSGPALKRNQLQVNRIRRFAEQHGMTAGQLALAWLLAQGDDVVPIPGTRKPDRATENAHAVHRPLTPDELAALEAAVPAREWSGDRATFAGAVTRR